MVILGVALDTQLLIGQWLLAIIMLQEIQLWILTWLLTQCCHMSIMVSQITSNLTACLEMSKQLKFYVWSPRATSGFRQRGPIMQLVFPCDDIMFLPSAWSLLVVILQGRCSSCMVHLRLFPIDRWQDWPRWNPTRGAVVGNTRQIHHINVNPQINKIMNVFIIALDFFNEAWPKVVMQWC